MCLISPRQVYRTIAGLPVIMSAYNTRVLTGTLYGEVYAGRYLWTKDWNYLPDGKWNSMQHDPSYPRHVASEIPEYEEV